MGGGNVPTSAAIITGGSLIGIVIMNQPPTDLENLGVGIGLLLILFGIFGHIWYTSNRKRRNKK